ncbi:MAG: exodeoxyribonuclease VII large subunit [SAR202 cluster bacterium]|nr:exodeoxyribonuclease VII large subunit [SAR202 cluster bacterium]
MAPVQTFSVAELAEYLKVGLERDPGLRDLWVSGEVSNLVKAVSGHAYFTLKDAAAALRCVLFKGGRGAQHLQHGAQINIHGRVSLYTQRGDLQIYADVVVPAGQGVLQAEFERLQAKLEAEGLFDVSRKRPLPAFPCRIGIVTSETGAVFHDIVRVLTHRYPLAEVVLCPAQVQGDEAPAQVAEAIRALNQTEGIDVIIAGRGGGSLEDLWAFNTELVARAIHASRVPVVSAVGHEADVTIADLVADLRAPTPSAAAMAVSPDVRELSNEVFALATRAVAVLDGMVLMGRRDVTGLVHRMRGRLPDNATARLGVDDLLERGQRALLRGLRRQKEQTEALTLTLAALDPRAVLARGYAILIRADTGTTVSSTSAVTAGDRIRATVRDGTFEAEVR